MIKLAPSILSADFAELRKEITILHLSPADYIHIDVMDGMFVPNISIGLPVIQSIRRYTADRKELLPRLDPRPGQWMV